VHRACVAPCAQALPLVVSLSPRAMQVAVEGCCHGELDKIYAAMRHLEAKENIKIDLLICCGDFQARADNRGSPRTRHE